MTLVMGYPSPTPIAAVTDKVAMVVAADGASRWLRAIAMVTGKSPMPRPWRLRPICSQVKSLDNAAITSPTITVERANSTTRRCRWPSASRHITGVASAPVSRVAVSIHSALESEM